MDAAPPRYSCAMLLRVACGNGRFSRTITPAAKKTLAPVSALPGEAFPSPMASKRSPTSWSASFTARVRKVTKRKALLWLLVSLYAILMRLAAALLAFRSPYLGRDDGDPGNTFDVFLIRKKRGRQLENQA